jgi:hypothetical protein
LDNAAPARLESMMSGAIAGLSGLVLGGIVPGGIDLDGEFAVATYLLERSLYGAMAAVLIVPELATFFVFVGFALGLALFAGRFAWALFNEEEIATPPSALIEPSQATG